MARIHAKGAKVFVDEFDFSGVTNHVRLDIDNGLGDVTAFADTDDTFVEGKAGFTLTVDGLFSTASPNYDGEMFTDLTAENRKVAILPPGFADGDVGYECNTNVSGQDRPAETSGIAGLHVEWQGDTPSIRATIMFKATAQAATANGTKRQLGALSATQQMVSTLRLLSAPGGAGANNCIVTIESDADSSAGGETLRITHATLNEASVATFEQLAVAGAVTDAWWRVVVTISGVGSRTFDLIVTLGIQPI